MLAVTSAGASNTSIFDLRKANLLTTVDIGSEIFHARFDLSGQFLAVASAGSVSVQEYSKKGKAFSQVFSKAVPSIDVAWGASAKSLLLLNKEGSLVQLA
jgi:pre-mRNA-processing factor 19